MSHQFEPQTEQQTRPDTPETTASSSITPASSTLELQNDEKAFPVAQSIAQRPQEQTLVPAIRENWQTLLLEWKQESRWSLRQYRPLLSLGIAVITVPVFLLMQSLWPSASAIPLLALLSWIVFWLLVACVQFERAAGWTPKQTNLLNQLAEVEDVNAAGPLLEIWKAAAPTGPVRPALGRALQCLLPRLRREDGANLTPAQRRILYNNISHANALYHPDMTLTLACLEAIEQVGDIHALPPLARLIVHDAPTQPEQRIRERAQQCLTHLTQNLDFGTAANIPGWIAKLPYGSSTANMPTLPAGTDEALIALFALIRLLPQLQPSDAGLLKAGEREYLAEAWRWMLFALYPSPGGSVSMQQSRLGSAFSFAVLAALEQIGTGRDLGLSHWLLCDVPAEELPQLRLQARRVNAILERRRDKEQVGQTLLRGASAPSAAPGELLRPAAAEHDRSDPKELLRPDEGGKRRY